MQEPVKRKPHVEPARAFECAAGLTGVAGRYRFPDGLSAADFEKMYTWRFAHEACRPEILQGKGMPVPAYAEDCLTRMQSALLGGDYSKSHFLQGLWADAVSAEFNHVMQTPDHPYRIRQRAVWDALVSLNPQLKNVQVGRMQGRAMYDAMMGVSSGFNVDDINHFLRRAQNGFPADPAAEAQRAAIRTRTGHYMGWVPSPETRAHVMQEIGLPLHPPLADQVSAKQSRAPQNRQAPPHPPRGP